MESDPLEIAIPEIAARIKSAAFRARLIIQTAGVQGSYLKITPCLFISPEELETSFQKFDQACEVADAGRLEVK